MQQQPQQRTGSISCRVRNLPRPFGYTLLTVPALAAFGALSLPALAGCSAAPSSQTQNVSERLATSSPSAAMPPVAANAAGHRSARRAHVPARTPHKPTSHGVDTQKARDAFFTAGYDYDDAVLLSRLWGQDMTPYDAKVRAGEKLIQHVAVPVEPGQTAYTVRADVALQAYFGYGYDYDDAAALAKAWQTPVTGTDYGDVKTTAGRKLLDGLRLPVGPNGTPAVTHEDKAVAAFFKAGYDYDDAVLLSRLWAQGLTSYDAKVQAGDMLLRHERPPTEPGATARTASQDAALLAYFDNGYGYDDAVRLAKIWRTPVAGGDYTGVKATAGRKLLAGTHLPAMG